MRAAAPQRPERLAGPRRAAAHHRDTGRPNVQRMNADRAGANLHHLCGSLLGAPAEQTVSLPGRAGWVCRRPYGVAAGWWLSSSPNTGSYSFIPATIVHARRRAGKRSQPSAAGQGRRGGGELARPCAGQSVPGADGWRP